MTASHDAKQSATTHQAEVAAMVAAEEAPKTEKAVEAAAPRLGRYCLRCGAAWLPGAGFCTQCGTAVHEAASEESEPVVAVPTQVARPTVKLPQLKVPALRPGQLFNRARATLNASYAAHTRGWEMTMSGMAIAFAVMAFFVDHLSGVPHAGLATLMLMITIVFVAEYAGRLIAADDRRRFFMGHLVELAAVVPWLRPLRVARLLWIMWLRAAGKRLGSWRSRLPLVPANGRGLRLMILWCALLLLSGVATYGYIAAGDSAGRDVRFALVVMLLCVFSGLTAALATAIAARAMGPAEIAERLTVLDELNAKSVITPEEYQVHRTTLVGLLSPADGNRVSDSRVRTAPRSDRAAQASGAS
ncbi:MAG TPA: zinc ribbon domain-containing protein [Candidatus Limnocylindria bacterium]